MRIFCVAYLILLKLWHETTRVLAFDDAERQQLIGTSIENTYEHDLCDTLYCRKGEECLVHGNVAGCHCRRSCPHNSHYVCGSNGLTYQSYCHLHAEACWLKTKLKVVHSGKCDNLISKKVWQQEQIIPIADAEKLSPNIEHHVHSSCDDLHQFLSEVLTHFQQSQMKTNGHEKPSTISFIFKFLDANKDNALSSMELNSSVTFDKFLSNGCRMNDLLPKGDLNANNLIEADEFFLLFGLPLAYLSPTKRIKRHLITDDKQYQLFCDIEIYHPGDKIKWFRYGVPLSAVATYNFQISTDSSLYLTPASLIHNGNFTCRLTHGSSVLEQVHDVHVIESPNVEVTPQFLLLTTDESRYLKCSVGNSYPIPRIIWEKNDVRLAENLTVLELANVTPKDTGSYKCTASTELGDAHATTTVVVSDHYHRPEIYYRQHETEKQEYFVAFSKAGLEMYSWLDCSLTKLIGGSYPVIELSSGFLCDYPHNCQWTSATSTKPGSFLYATLSDQKLLVKMNITAGTVDQIFRLNHTPMRLWYVPWEDTVWVESYHDKNGFYRTIQIVRSASQTIRHSLSHILPVNNEFDSVANIFLPTQQLNYGYVTHWQETALHKVDLRTTKTVYRINLAKYDCHPLFVSFAYQNGLIIVDCANLNDTLTPIGQLVLDYLSDAVIMYDENISGESQISANGQFLYTVNVKKQRIFVRQIVDKIISPPKVYQFDMLNIDWILHADKKSTSWSLFAASLSSDYLLRLNTENDKISNVFHFNVNDQKKKRGADESRTPMLASLDDRFLLIADNDTIINVDLYKDFTTHCHIQRPFGTMFLKLN